MKTATHTPRGKARDHILKVACDLFYRQGYHPTGVQQIIDEAGVSKATFYAHYKSKEILGLCYLREQDRQAQAIVKAAIDVAPDARERFLAPAKALIPWLEEDAFRGCMFSNMAAEIPDPQAPMRKEVKFHADAFRAIARDLSEDLLRSVPEAYGHLDPQELADEYYLIVWGGITGCQHYHAIWPMKQALKLLQKLISLMEVQAESRTPA